MVENAQVLVDRARWSQSDKEDNYKNKKAMTILLASMSKEKGGKVQHCISAKEIQETLKDYYEGNVQLRSKKVQLRGYEYELFKIKLQEW